MPELLDVKWLIDHYVQFWGRPVAATHIYPPEVPTDMWVVTFPPQTEGDVWTYATATTGALQLPPPPGQPLFELYVVSQIRNDELISLLFALAQYGLRNNTRLGPLHTILGDTPVVSGSLMTDLLLARPTGEPPELEFIAGDPHIHLLWLVPLHRTERLYKVEHGWPALRHKFADQDTKISDLFRSSVIT